MTTPVTNANAVNFEPFFFLKPGFESGQFAAEATVLVVDPSISALESSKIDKLLAQSGNEINFPGLHPD